MILGWGFPDEAISKYCNEHQVVIIVLLALRYGATSFFFFSFFLFRERRVEIAQRSISGRGGGGGGGVFFLPRDSKIVVQRDAVLIAQFSLKREGGGGVTFHSLSQCRETPNHCSTTKKKFFFCRPK